MDTFPFEGGGSSMMGGASLLNSPFYTYLIEMWKEHESSFHWSSHCVSYALGLILSALAVDQTCKISKIGAKRRIHLLNIVSGFLIMTALPMRYYALHGGGRSGNIINTDYYVWRAVVVIEALLAITMYLTGCYIAFRCYIVYAAAENYTRRQKSQGLQDMDMPVGSEKHFLMQHVGRTVVSLIITGGIVMCLILDKLVLRKAKFAVVGAGTPLLRGQGPSHHHYQQQQQQQQQQQPMDIYASYQIEKSTKMMQRNINKIATFAAVSGIVAALASFLTIFGSRGLLYPATVFEYGFFIHYAWQRPSYFLGCCTPSELPSLEPDDVSPMESAAYDPYEVGELFRTVRPNAKSEQPQRLLSAP
eukprot:jgi/Bigna1/70485/fgenesh1_pg.12_\